MKQAVLAYGKTGLHIDVPDEADVLTAVQSPGLPDEASAILNALRHPINSGPLKGRVTPGDSAVIVHTDITREWKTRLESAGIPLTVCGRD